jgi:LysR family transcriptional regulator, glycine cleavage system transcriptional activator
MIAPTHLRSLQALDMALRKGSLKAAAEALAITPAAAGQRIKTLETYLGFELLARGRAGLQARPELRSALPHLVTAFRALDAAVEQLDMQRGFEIHIAAVPDFADLWLKPRLMHFERQNSQASLSVNGEGDAPLRLGPADCEITFGPWRAEDQVDLLFRDFLIPMCSPTTQRRIERLDSRTRLEGYPLLHLDFYRNDPRALTWEEWVAASPYRRSAPQRGIRFQRIAHAIDALLADAGLAICGAALLQEPLKAGALTMPFPRDPARGTSHGYLVRYRREALMRPQVRRFRQWLVDQAAVTATWLATLESRHAATAMPSRHRRRARRPVKK